MFDVLSVSPFGLPGHWFKGCLHVHSTASDGCLTPGEVIDWYRSRGYHFLALTDHDVLSEAHSLAEDFITLSGIEIDCVDPLLGEYHLVGLGLIRSPDLGRGKLLAFQEAIDRARTAGGLVSLAHPYWSGLMSEDLLAMEGCFALEVYSGSCELDNGKGFSIVHWDDLLAAGHRLWGLAVDDAHWHNGMEDADLGWVWVKAPALAQEAILDALHQGHFYASSGPQILDLQLDESHGQLRVLCSPSVAVDFIGYGSRGCRITAPPGETLTSASYVLKKGQRYVRVACRDAQGCWAWSNPLFLEEDRR